MVRIEDIYLKRGDVSVRPLTEDDAQHILKWLRDPAVLEWYEGRDKPATPEWVRENYYDDFIGKYCIIEYKNAPAGFIQVYPVTGEDLSEYGLSADEKNVFAMDQFIGEPSLWGKGIGRIFVSEVADHLMKNEGCKKVVLDPRRENTRAIRCYEACGFKKVKLLPAHELHEGEWRDCVLMEYREEKDEV